jgi:hypothetical protein
MNSLGPDEQAPTANADLIALAGDDRDTLTKVLGGQEWNTPPDFPDIWAQSAHDNHEYHSACAICRGDIDRIVEVILASEWLTTHDAVKRERIAEAIEAHTGRDVDYDDGMEAAARIARAGSDHD